MYYYSENGQVKGPFQADQLAGKISPDTLVFIENGVKWTKANEIAELQFLFSSPTPSTDEPSDNIDTDISTDASVDNPLPESDPGIPAHSSAPDESMQYDFRYPVENAEKKSGKKLILIILLLLLVVGFSLFYYYWLSPYLRDKNAPRKYCYIESLVVRSSKIPGVEYNVIGKCQYGDEVLVYENDGIWIKGKLNGQECFLAEKYLLNKGDFHLLNSIFFDEDSRKAVNNSNYRIALLEYFKKRNYMGVMEEQLEKEIFMINPKREIWQLKALNKYATVNNVFFERVVNPEAKYKDFACILTNLLTGSRKFLLFSVSDDERVSLEDEQDAPDSGYIESVDKAYDFSGVKYFVNYSQYAKYRNR